MTRREHRPHLVLRAFGGAGLWALAATALLFTAGLLGHNSMVRRIVPIGTALCAVGAAAHVVVAHRRVMRALDTTVLTACTTCGYDLRDAGQRGTCPECGDAFEIDTVRAHWERYLADSRAAAGLLVLLAWAVGAFIVLGMIL